MDWRRGKGREADHRGRVREQVGELWAKSAGEGFQR